MAKQHVFISYCRDNLSEVARLREDLIQAGEPVWWDQDGILAGQDWELTIEQAIEHCYAFIACLSKETQARFQTGIYPELDKAVEIYRKYLPDQVFIIPVRLSECQIPPLKIRATTRLNNLHYVDLFPPAQRQAGLQKLFKSLQAAPERPPSGDRTPPMGRLFNVPALPDYFLARPKILAELIAKVLGSDTKAVGITNGLKVGVQGMGGIGKSVLAAALAQEEKVRRAFPDGIYWIVLGQQPMLTLRQADLIEGVSRERVDIADVQQGRLRLEIALADKACLVLVDDVWRLSDLVAFDVLGPRSRLVFTTRHADIVHQIAGAIEQTVEQFSPQASLELLAKASGCARAALPKEVAREVARECGYLPLALTLAGKMIDQPDLWPDVLKALRQADWEQLEADFPHYPYRHVFAAIEASINALESTEAERYRELAVFPDVAIPEAALAVLWEPLHLNRLALHKLVRRFTERGLATWDEQQRLMLHDLQRDFIRKRAQDLPALHQRLLEAYWAHCPNGWASGPNDGYFFAYLSWHLFAAERRSELGMLLLDFAWLEAKLQVSGINALLRDYANGMTDPPLSLVQNELACIQDALRLSAHVLALDKTQLRSQLYGRLMAHRTIGIQGLLAQLCKAPAGPWLRPYTATLKQPGGPLVRTLTNKREDWIEAVATTPDGHYALSASHSVLTLWDLHTGAEVRRLPGSGEAVALTPDGHYALSASYRTLTLWDLHTGAEMHRLDCEGWGKTVAVTPDGRYALVASGDSPLKLWDLASRKEIHTLTDYFQGDVPTAISGDGRYILCATDDNAWKLWDLARRTKAYLLSRAQKVEAITPDGHYALYLSDEKVVVWDLYTNTERHFDAPNDGYNNNKAAITSDGGYLLSAYYDRFRGPMLKLWDLSNGMEVGILEGHTNKINHVAIESNGRYALSVSNDKMMLWDLERVTTTHSSSHHDGKILAIIVTPDGRYALSAALDGKLKLWDLHTGAEVKTLTEVEKLGDDLLVTPDGRYVLCISNDYDANIKLIDLQSGLVKRTFKGHCGDIEALALTPDGRFVISASNDAPYPWDDPYGFYESEPELYVWNLNNGKQVHTLQKGGSSVISLAVTADGRHLVSLSTSSEMKVWDLSSGKIVYTLKDNDKGYDSLASIAVTPDGHYLLYATHDRIFGRIEVWDLKSHEIVHRLNAHNDTINAICISSDGRLAISVSDDAMLKLWEVSSGIELASFSADRSLEACAMSQDSMKIVAGDNWGRMYFLRLEGL